MTLDHNGFTINASRIGARGGLRAYAEAVVECLAMRFSNVDAVMPPGFRQPEHVRVFLVPRWLGSSARISKLRPILWLAYSVVFFPISRSRRVLSTTHHSLPFCRHQILTVHDIRPYFEPDTWVQKLYFHRMLRRALRRCDGILTVSETSKRDIIAVYGIDEHRIFVVPNSLDTSSIKDTEGASLAERDAPYLLMVGASWKHKNAVEVLAEHNSWRRDFRLKIVAGVGQYCEQLKRQASALGIRDRVDFLHDVRDFELAALYRQCRALVYPSRMEGFGLPPLEAMSYGKPVIVSDLPVFRELFEDAPYFVELGNSASWERVFSELLRTDSESLRLHCERGRAVASKYSRERMCTGLADAINQIWGITPNSNCEMRAAG